MTGEKIGLLAGLRAEALKSRHAAPVRLAVLMALPMPLLGAMPYRGVRRSSARGTTGTRSSRPWLSRSWWCASRRADAQRGWGASRPRLPARARLVGQGALVSSRSARSRTSWSSASTSRARRSPRRSLTAAGTLTMLLCALANTVTAAWMIPAGLFLTARLGMLAGIFCPLAAQLVGGFAWSLMPLPQLFPPSGEHGHPHQELHPRAAERRATRGGHGARRGRSRRTACFTLAGLAVSALAFAALTAAGAALFARSEKRGDGHDATFRPDAAHDAPAGSALRGPAPGALPLRGGCTSSAACSRSCLRQYFSVTRWDPALGADAYAQFLGLHAAHVRHRLRVSPWTSALPGASPTSRRPSRGRCRRGEAARPAALGAGALAVAAGVFGAVLAVAGRLPLGPAPLAAAWAGIVLGSLPSTRWGSAWPCASAATPSSKRRRGIPRVLLSGRTCARPHDRRAHRCPGDAPELVPLAWPARLGSLGVEASSTRTRGGPLLTTALAGLVLTPGSRRRPYRLVLPASRDGEGRCIGSRSPSCSSSSPQRSSWAGMPCSTPAGGRRCARSPTACCPTLRSP